MSIERRQADAWGGVARQLAVQFDWNGIALRHLELFREVVARGQREGADMILPLRRPDFGDAAAERRARLPKEIARIVWRQPAKWIMVAPLYTEWFRKNTWINHRQSQLHRPRALPVPCRKQ